MTIPPHDPRMESYNWMDLGALELSGDSKRDKENDNAIINSLLDKWDELPIPDPPPIEHHETQNQTQNVSTSSTPYDPFFTPLILPAMTPLDSMGPPVDYAPSEFFTPLTLPAIHPTRHGLPKNAIFLNEAHVSLLALVGLSTLRKRSSGRVGKSKNSLPVIKAVKGKRYDRRPSGGNIVEFETKDELIEKPITPAELMKKKEEERKKDKGFPNTTTFSSFKTYKLKTNLANKSVMELMMAHQTQFKLNLLSKNKSEPEPEKTGKKSLHKDAEKGRRDRMNVAIHELALLIPEELISTVAVPLKATTVELASKYIIMLTEEVERLKREKNL